MLVNTADVDHSNSSLHCNGKPWSRPDSPRSKNGRQHQVVFLFTGENKAKKHPCTGYLMTSMLVAVLTEPKSTDLAHLRITGVLGGL